VRHAQLVPARFRGGVCDTEAQPASAPPSVPEEEAYLLHPRRAQQLLRLYLNKLASPRALMIRSYSDLKSGGKDASACFN